MREALAMRLDLKESRVAVSSNIFNSKYEHNIYVEIEVFFLWLILSGFIVTKMAYFGIIWKVRMSFFLIANVYPFISIIIIQIQRVRGQTWFIIQITYIWVFNHLMLPFVFIDHSKSNKSNIEWYLRTFNYFHTFRKRKPTLMIPFPSTNIKNK